MVDAMLVPLLLVGIGLVLAVIAVTLVVVAMDLRRTLRGVDALLPDCHRAVQEARRVLSHAQAASHHLAGVIVKACNVAALTIDQVGMLKDRAETFLSERLGIGNGARAGSLRHHRRV